MWQKMYMLLEQVVDVFADLSNFSHGGLTRACSQTPRIQIHSYVLYTTAMNLSQPD